MAILRLIAYGAAALVASESAGYAGPCSTEIDSMQARIDALLDARAGAGSIAVESPGALMHRQPTPDSIAAAEEKIDKLPARQVDGIQQTMAHARGRQCRRSERLQTGAFRRPRPTRSVDSQRNTPRAMKRDATPAP